MSQNFNRSCDPECTPYCTPLTCVMTVLFTFNTETKFEMSSFVRSKHMTGTPKYRNGLRDPDHAYLGDSQATRG